MPSPAPRAARASPRLLALLLALLASQALALSAAVAGAAAAGAEAGDAAAVVAASEDGAAAGVGEAVKLKLRGGAAAAANAGAGAGVKDLSEPLVYVYDTQARPGCEQLIAQTAVPLVQGQSWMTAGTPSTCVQSASGLQVELDNPADVTSQMSPTGGKPSMTRVTFAVPVGSLAVWFSSLLLSGKSFARIAFVSATNTGISSALYVREMESFQRCAVVAVGVADPLSRQISLSCRTYQVYYFTTSSSGVPSSTVSAYYGWDFLMNKSMGPTDVAV